MPAKPPRPGSRPSLSGAEQRDVDRKLRDYVRDEDELVRDDDWSDPPVPYREKQPTIRDAETVPDTIPPTKALQRAHNWSKMIVGIVTTVAALVGSVFAAGMKVQAWILHIPSTDEIKASDDKSNKAEIAAKDAVAKAEACNDRVTKLEPVVAEAARQAAEAKASVEHKLTPANNTRPRPKPKPDAGP